MVLGIMSHWKLCHFGYFGIGYYVTLGILALGIMALGIMNLGIMTCNPKMVNFFFIVYSLYLLDKMINAP